MMEVKEFLKKELSGWRKRELTGLFIALAVIFYNAIFLQDNIIAVCSSIFGILYTIIAGKGKISCYFFGIMGSGCYVYLSFLNLLIGNGFLYLLYYIPMQVLGIFRWSKHMQTGKSEIIKSKMSVKRRIKYSLIGIAGCAVTIYILNHFGDKSPVIDGITTFLSILGMYFTVRRLFEQWVVWIIVNGLSFLMWLNLVIHGAKAYSTLVMWGVYFIFAIYFFTVWGKELKNLSKNSDL